MTSDPLTSLNVSLPTAQKEFVLARAQATGCTTASEFVRRLIAAEQQRELDRLLERRALEAIASGPGEVTGPEFFDKIRERISKGLEKPASEQ